jgi:hypothetical protein
VNVDVTDYYTNGAKDPFGKPTIMSIYERAYGIHYGDKNLDDGGTGAEAMEAISGEETTVCILSDSHGDSSPGSSTSTPKTSGTT